MTAQGCGWLHQTHPGRLCPLACRTQEASTDLRAHACSQLPVAVWWGDCVTVRSCAALHPSQLHVPRDTSFGASTLLQEPGAACVALEMWRLGRCWQHPCLASHLVHAPYQILHKNAAHSACRAHLGLLHSSLLPQQHVVGVGHLADKFLPQTLGVDG